jgi:hypothetical protein
MPNSRLFCRPQAADDTQTDEEEKIQFTVALLVVEAERMTHDRVSGARPGHRGNVYIRVITLYRG